MLNCAQKMTTTADKIGDPPPECKRDDSSSPIKKPIVLSSQRFAKVLNNALNIEQKKSQKESEEEQKYKEYLKKGSHDLVAQFKGNMARTQEEKREEMKQALDQKTAMANKSFELYKENDEKERRVKIAKAQQLIEKLKPGPRDLHGAALQSEVLRARNVQRNINAEFEKAVKKQESEQRIACQRQAMPWIEEEQQRIDERIQRTNIYKQEMLESIAESQKQKADHKRQSILKQQAAREALDLEIKAQIEKEKAIMEKKRASLRKNALEAMKMVEQRRMRERMTDELEDRLCCVYNTGKRQLDHMQESKVKQQCAEREKAAEASAKFLSGLQQNLQAVEAERLRRDISVMQLKFTAEEQEKIRKDKAAKQARIEAYMKDLQQQKEARQREAEQKRFEMAQRFKNTEVNCLFVEAQKQEKLNKVKEVREKILAQAEENKQTAAKSEKEGNRKCENEKRIKEDQFFFDYARVLMEDAKKKERPLYPFVKVVQQYKKDNQIDCVRKTPKHLVSHLTMGCRQPGDSKADEAAAASSSKDENKSSLANRKQNILENCLKITEMIASNKGEQEGPCPMQCLHEANARNDGLQDGVSMTASGKLRYSMNELKKLNQFAAPTLH